MNDIKQYLEETNTVLLTKETFERLKERACVLDKISAEMEMALMTDIAIDIQDKKVDEVLGKIRAEIEEHAKINQNLNPDRARALCWCLDVIDKYKAESEE